MKTLLIIGILLSIIIMFSLIMFQIKELFVNIFNMYYFDIY